MNNLLLSVLTDIKAFVTENLYAVIAACALVLIIVVIIIAACAAKAKRRKRSASKPAAEESATKQPATEQPAAETQTSPEQPAIETEPVSELQPVAEPAEEQSAAEQSEPVKSAIEQPAEVQPVYEQSVSETQPISEESATEQSSPVQPAIEQPAPEAEPIPETQPAPEAEPVPETQPAPETEPVTETAPSTEQTAEGGVPQGRITFIKPRPGMFIRYRYNRSFEAKLIQSDDVLKARYAELKRALLSYKRVTPRISWRHESFRYGRPSVAKFVIRGKTLCLCLALDPAQFAESKYLVEDMSRYAKFANTPLLYRIKNDRRCRYAKELIAKLFEDAEGAVPPQDDFAAIPYEDTQSLVERGLIRIVSYEEVAITNEGEVPAEEYEDDDDFAGEQFDDDDDEDELDEVSAADAGMLMADDKAKHRVQQGEEISDKTKTAVINIDTLDQYFSEGERVTLAEIKKRCPFIAGNATYIKVLARGTLSKPLIVIADDFSLEAVKMIVLTGGRAIRNKKNTK